MKKRFNTGLLATLALLLVLTATVVPFFLNDNATAMTAYKYLYGAGAVLLFASRVFDGRTSSDFRLKRLYRLDVAVSLLFIAGTVILFWPGAALRDWVAFTMAGAALQVYTSIAIPSRESKLKTGSR